MTMTLEEYETINPETAVRFRGQDLKYWTPTRYTQARASCLFSRGTMYERETIRWINSMDEGDLLVDIGANVGIYSVFAAANKIKVIAIEPESSNYSALNRNIKINDYDGQIIAYCLGMSDKTGPDELNIYNEGVGYSCHNLGEDLDPCGSPMIERGIQSRRQGIMAYRLDDLLASLGHPAPTHIKIDVDGIEHKVVAGMLETLDHPALQTVLIELNSRHPNHPALYEAMAQKGFSFSEHQVESSMIAEGAEGGWGGTCNVIFYREGGYDIQNLWSKEDKELAATGLLGESAALNLYDKVNDVEIIEEPTPHFVIDDVFSETEYEKILANLPNASQYCPMDELGWTNGAHHRFVFAHRDDFYALLPEHKDIFLRNFIDSLCSENLVKLCAVKFSQWIPELVAAPGVLTGVSVEAALTKDYDGYEISPHTDAVDRVLTMMYYLPRSMSNSDAGTVLYRPKDKNFECSAGRNYPFEDFEEIKRIPYKPNTLFGFVKTSNSFHGVPPLNKVSVDRDIIHITMHLKNRPQLTQ